MNGVHAFVVTSHTHTHTHKRDMCQLTTSSRFWCTSAERPKISGSFKRHMSNSFLKIEIYARFFGSKMYLTAYVMRARVCVACAWVWRSINIFCRPSSLACFHMTFDTDNILIYFNLNIEIGNGTKREEKYAYIRWKAAPNFHAAKAKLTCMQFMCEQRAAVSVCLVSETQKKWNKNAWGMNIRESIFAIEFVLIHVCNPPEYMCSTSTCGDRHWWSTK